MTKLFIRLTVNGHEEIVPIDTDNLSSSHYPYRTWRDALGITYYVLEVTKELEEDRWQCRKCQYKNSAQDRKCIVCYSNR